MSELNIMNDEFNYIKSVSYEHIKKNGQYFTNHDIADFMCSWACKNAKTVLDPAVGNSIFFSYTKKYNQNCELIGYEIDQKILQYFGNPLHANIINEDYLLNGWNNKFDAIVCNPPYNKFQAITNRGEILESIYTNTGIKYSGYTNLYILFLIKSIHQLSDKGRLAYIIPSEFMNSDYGTDIKQLLIDRKLLRAIINFENNNEIFFNAITTCCILLLDYEPKNDAVFYNLSSIEQLSHCFTGDKYDHHLRVKYKYLKANKKWRPYISQESSTEYTNLKSVYEFCHVTRGIATGANDFFCFSLKKAEQMGIPKECLERCICRSSDITTPIFDTKDFEDLSNANKTVYLLNVTNEDYEQVKDYIKFGEENGVNRKYLPSCRTPWYSMEKKNIAPIWVSSACRKKIKFVRNIAMAKSLTTFHSIFIHPNYNQYIDLIFCYFLTPVAQTIIRENRKELGNGLEKFQPNDLNNAKMLDIEVISSSDKAKVKKIYEKIKISPSQIYVKQLNEIFYQYLVAQ